MKEDPLKTEFFVTEKEAFFRERSRIRTTTTVQRREKLINSWIEQALLSNDFVSRQSDWYEALKRKSSEDGLLYLGFEFGECVGLPNPLLYAKNLRGATRRRDHLGNILNQIFLDISTGEKTNPPTEQTN